jgi:FKBP-type peptidyl-prolyl cis-trans isomerase FkpA
MNTRRLIVPSLIAALSLTAAACGDSSPTEPTPRAEYSTTDLRVGTGTEATAGRTLTVNYTGWLYNPSGQDGKGSQFDTSVGKAPFSFPLGRGSVISGWDRGVAGMRVGGVRRLVLPPELAYGPGGNPPAIPGNATLVFDVELLNVQ